MLFTLASSAFESRVLVGIRTATRKESRYEISRALGNGNENGATVTRYHLGGGDWGGRQAHGVVEEDTFLGSFL